MSTSTREVITHIDVTHVPNEFGTPAHIRVTGHTTAGAFTIRKISGLRTGHRIDAKIAEAKATYATLIGLEVKIITRASTKRGNPPVRVVNHNTLPAWALGDWEKVIPKKA